MYGSFLIFNNIELDHYLKENDQKIVDFINHEPDDNIIDVDMGEYIPLLEKKFSIKLPYLYFEKISTSIGEEEVWDGGVDTVLFTPTGYKKEVVVFHIPCDGNRSLLHYKLNPSLNWAIETRIEDNCITFRVDKTNTEDIKQKSDQIINNLKKQYSYLTKQIENYNADLKENIISIFNARKKEILDKNEVLKSLGLPIKTGDLTENYSSDSIREKEIAEEDSSGLNLSENIYQEVLKTIFYTGISIETKPSLYKGKDEEELRDILLLSLQNSSNLSATGETFNKKGKTDILIRHGNVNVFVAECKIWRGESQYLDSIDQLLGYLTWRDSKAAIIVFVKNKRISHVLETIKEATVKHSNYLEHVNDEKDSWFNYYIHIEDDVNLKVKLAILIFHIPDIP
jgi:hypothetical protein